MSWTRLLLRALVAVTSFALVSVGLLAAFGMIALAVEWDLPERDAFYGPSSVFDRNGVPLARFKAEVERRPVPLERIAPQLQHAVLAKEDHRFYQHEGVDPLSVVRAVVRNVVTGGIAEGGSTLTQQYVKNVYVGSDRTVYRKIREAVVALQLEKERTKDEILEDYLNRVYFGDGAYGAEAAALAYFEKPAAELSLAEAATLAGVLTAPSRFSPRNNPEGALERRNLVLDLMVEHGFAVRERAEAAKREPLELAERRRSLSVYPYFLEEVRQQLVEAYGPEAVYRGGLLVTTTLDVQAQRALQSEVGDQLPPDPALDAGVAAVQPGTGDVLATYSGRDFRQSQVDLALGEGFGRPSGSTFKAIVLAAALEDGLTLESTYPAPSVVRIGDWTPSGGGCGGRCTVLQATVNSINTVFAQIGRDVGAEKFTDVARRLGVRSPLHPSDITQALGTSDVTPIDLASAFATFANGGVACPPRVVLEVRDVAGTKLEPPDPLQPSPEERARWAEHFEELGYRFGEQDLGRCYRAIAPSVAGDVTTALEGVVRSGTGRRARIDRPQAGKTGTTNDYREAWFVGYTPHLSMAVFFGARDDNRPLVGVPGCGGPCFGGTLPARIWREAASPMLADMPPEAFPDWEEERRFLPERRRLGPPVRSPAPDPPPEEPDEDEEEPEEPDDEPPTEEGPDEEDDPEEDDGGLLPL